MSGERAISPEDPGLPLRARRAWAVALCGGGTLYVATGAPGLLWGDSGEAQLHVLLGKWLVGGQICRSHVTYYACARALAAVSGWTPALAANLIAALFGALTVANAAHLLVTWKLRTSSVVAGALLLALSHTLWRLSTGAEVLSLTTALMTAEWIAVSRLLQRPGRRWAVIVGLLNGLGVATHNLALLAWPAYLVTWLRWRRNLPEHGMGLAATGMLGWALGASPLLALMLANHGSLGGFGGTLHSWLIGTYAGAVLNMSHLPALALRSIGYVIMNFPTPVVILCVPGWWALRRRTTEGFWTFITVHALALLAFVVRYDVADQYTFFVCVHVVVALGIAVGVETTWTGVRSAATRISAQTRVLLLLPACALAPLAYGVVPVLLRAYWPDIPVLPSRRIPHRDTLSWFIQPWRVGERGTEQFLDELFDALGPGAMLYCDSQFTGPIIYRQVASGLRKDVRLDPPHELQGGLAPPAEAPRLREEALRDGRYYVCSQDARYRPPWFDERTLRLEPAGPVFKVSPREPRP